MKSFIKISLLGILSTFLFLAGFNLAGAQQYYDSGALMTVPEGSGLTAIGYGSDDKACTLSIQYAPVNPDGTINFNNIGSTSVTCTNGPGDDPDNPGAPYQAGRYAVGWTWGTKSGSPSSGGRYSASPYDDDFPDKMCYYQEYASLVDIGNNNTSNYKRWYDPYTGSCVIDGYWYQSWLKRVLYAPPGTVIVSIGMSLANDGDVGPVTMVTRAGPVAPDPISVSISASPTSMTLPTNSSTLSWSTTGNPTSCTASGAWSGSKTASGGSEVRSSLTAGTYTYTITCSKTGVSDAVASVTVNVADQVCSVVNFSASPNPISTSASTGVTTISVNVNCNYDIRIGSPSGNLFASGLAGSRSHTTDNWVTNGMVFYLQKQGDTTAGGTMSTLTVNLVPPASPSSISVNLSASPTSMTYPSNSTTLSWTTSGSPDSCTSSGGWSGVKSTSGGSQSITGLTVGSHGFVITCSKSGLTDVTSSATVVVNAGSSIGVSISASPTSMTLPTNATTLSWSTSGSPESCTASGSWFGSKNAAGGSEARTGLTAGTYTYTITCSKTGVSDAVATISVNVNPSACDFSITGHQGYDPNTGLYSSTIKSSDYLILYGNFGTNTDLQNATIRYIPQNVNANLTYRGPAGSPPPNHQINIYPLPGSGTYTIEVRKNSDCAASRSVNIVYNSPISVSLSANPTTLNTGQSTLISWSTSGNPTSCSASSGPWFGSKSTTGGSEAVNLFTAGSYTFGITCTKSGVSPAGASRTVTVTAPPPPPSSCDPSVVGTNRMLGCVYSGTTFNSLVTTISTLTGPTLASPVPNTASPLPNFNWGSGGPSASLVNNFSVRWKGRFNFPAGTYVFTTASDDGSRAYFDDNNDGVPDSGYLVSDWSNHAIRSISGSPVTLSAGTRTLVYEMYEASGGAGYGLSWVRQGTVPSVTIQGNPLTGNSPLTTTLSWSVTGNPTSCVASGGWSGDKTIPTGSEVRSGITTNTTYTLNCSNSEGTGTGSVTITPSSSHSLDVFKTYGGYVRSVDTLINCGSNCSRDYASGTVVTLTAYPDSSAWRFVGWQGDCSGTGNCVLTIDSPKEVTAVFSLKPLIYREF